MYDGNPEVMASYVVIVEQDTLTKCRDLVTALYVMLSIHYIFNFSYHTRVKELFRFIQEVIMEIIDTEKKSAAFSNFFCVIAAAEQKL